MENSEENMHVDIGAYTQTKKTMNTENIPGMFVLTNPMRDLVTAEKKKGFSVMESRWFSICSERPQNLTFIFILQELKLHPFYLRATCTLQAKIQYV